MRAALAALILAVILALSLTGCRIGPPCSGHGGVVWSNGRDYQCADGTWE